MLTEPELKKLFDGFPLWLKTKDPDEEYRYTSPDQCAFAQYLKAVGHTTARVTNDEFTFDDWRTSNYIREDIRHAVFLPLGYSSGSAHRTFGMLQHSFMVADLPDVPVNVGPLVAGNL